MSKKDKAEAIKEHAINGRFAEIESEFGAKVAPKGREYAHTKLVALKAKIDAGEDIIQLKYATEFLKFAVDFAEPYDMENLERTFNERKTPVQDETTAIGEDLTQPQENDEVFSEGEETVDHTQDNDSSKAAKSDEAIAVAGPSSKRSGFQMPGTQGFIGVKKSTTAQADSGKKIIKSNVPDSKTNHKKSISVIECGKNNKKHAKEKKEKDPNAPKRPLNSFLLFSESNRAGVIAENPLLKHTEVMRELGLIWAALEDIEKEPFLERARLEKEAYEIEMGQYKREFPKIEGKMKKTKENKKQKSKMIPPKKSAVSDSDDDTVDMQKERKGTSSSDDEDLRDMSKKRKIPIKSKRIPVKFTPPVTAKRAKVTPASRSKGDTVENKVVYIDPVAAAKHDAKVVAALKGIKESDLPISEDIKKVKTVPREKCSFPTDFIPVTGDKVILVLEAYREFVSELGGDLLTPEDLELIQAICTSTEAVAHATVTDSRKIDNLHVASDEGAETAQILSLTIAGKKQTVLYVPFSSPLLRTEVFLLDRATYSKSLKASWLIPNAQVRRLLADETGKRGVWHEGSIYNVRSDMKTNPYASVSVVWMEQEMRPKTWFYSYQQLDNLCSPWDLELSRFVLPENVRPTVLPHSLRGGGTSKNVLTYLKTFDFSSVFMYDLANNEEYCKMFSKEEERLDLHVIVNRSNEGRYDGHGCLSMLFDELQLMTHNGKLFNSCNEGYQPWTLVDMMEIKVAELRLLLCGNTDKKLSKGPSAVMSAIDDEASDTEDNKNSEANEADKDKEGKNKKEYVKNNKDDSRLEFEEGDEDDEIVATQVDSQLEEV